MCRRRSSSQDRGPLIEPSADWVSPNVPALDLDLLDALKSKVDGLAKPLGSLGRLEGLAVQIGAVQGDLNPQMDRIRAYVFAGDHGLNAEGVSSYPSSVTAAMVATFLAEKATVNAWAKRLGVEVQVVDAGVDERLSPHPGLLDLKIRRGSRNSAAEDALTAAEVCLALDRGVDLAGIATQNGVDALIPGEMGIGNTASASLLLHRLALLPLEACIGVGAGHDAEGLKRKRAAIEKASARTAVTDPLGTLAAYGGLEIAMMTGLILGGAAHRRLILVDGFISSVAALAAIRMTPNVREYCVFCHASAERGHQALLEHLNVEPLLHLGLRLGEGTGAVLAAPLIRAACAMLNDVASLQDVLDGRL